MKFLEAEAVLVAVFEGGFIILFGDVFEAMEIEDGGAEFFAYLAVCFVVVDLVGKRGDVFPLGEDLF